MSSTASPRRNRVYDQNEPPRHRSPSPHSGLRRRNSPSSKEPSPKRYRRHGDSLSDRSRSDGEGPHSGRYRRPRDPSIDGKPRRSPPDDDRDRSRRYLDPSPGFRRPLHRSQRSRSPLPEIDHRRPIRRRGSPSRSPVRNRSRSPSHSRRRIPAGRSISRSPPSYSRGRRRSLSRSPMRHGRRSRSPDMMRHSPPPRSPERHGSADRLEGGREVNDGGSRSPRSPSARDDRRSWSRSPRGRSPSLRRRYDDHYRSHDRQYYRGGGYRRGGRQFGMQRRREDYDDYYPRNYRDGFRHRRGLSNDRVRDTPMTEEEKKKKEMEDARRDDLTVLVVNISLKADEKDLYNFFTKHAGKVKDIRLIKDSRSGKSKGIGYIEFADAESVLKSLNLTGQCILNQPIRVQASQAEKNRAAKAAKQQQAELAAQGPTKLYIGGLTDVLANITADDIRQLFSPFGQILLIEVPEDPYTRKNRGFAFVQYKTAAEAREAMSVLHGFEVMGKQLKVGFAGDEQPKTAGSGGGSMEGATTASGVDLDRIADDHDDRFLHGGPAMRLQLSQKLQQKSADQIPLMTSGAGNGSNGGPSLPPGVTEVLSLGNTFTKEEVERDGLEILDDVIEDIRTECVKFGEVLSAFVDRRALDGTVHVQFAEKEQAAAAFKVLHGRFFGGTPIRCHYTEEAAYSAMRRAL